MARCEECLHYKPCVDTETRHLKIILLGDKAERCKHFMTTSDVAPKSEWISVDERLPENGQEVLAYRGDFRGDMMNTYTYIGTGKWEDDYGYRGSAKHEGITHWIPMPEPPITDKPTQE